MSGPICPDCSWGHIVDREAGNSTCENACVFCGWEGERLPYKRLHIVDHEEQVAVHADKVARREAGQLFFLRVYFDGEGEQAGDPVDEAIDEWLGVLGQSWRGGYSYAELPERPVADAIARLEALPGVTKVVVR